MPSMNLPPRRPEIWLVLGRTLAVVCVALATLLGCRSESSSHEVDVDADAPAVRHDEALDFTLPTLGDGALTLSDFRGEVVVLNFWATWCAPCIVEVPEFVAVQEMLGDRGVTVVGVSQDMGPEAFEEVADFAERLHVNYPLALDVDLEVGRAYRVTSLPTTMVIDQDGRIRSRKVGLVKRDDILAMLDGLVEIEPALGERPPSSRPRPSERPPTEAPDVPDDPPIVEAVSVEAARALFDEGVMIVDLRSSDERALRGVIPFSLAVALDSIDPSALPANLAAPVVFVSGDDETAWLAANRAATWGYLYAHPVIGGFEAWLAAEMPVVALGEEDEDLEDDDLEDAHVEPPPEGL